MRKCCKLFALSAAFALLLCASACGGDKTAASVFQGAEIAETENEDTQAYEEPAETDLTEETEEKADEEPAGKEIEEETPVKSPETAPSEKEEIKESAGESARDYVLNKNSKKFHYPNCSAVSKMSEKNRLDFHGTRSEIINMGYSSCGICKP